MTICIEKTLDAALEPIGEKVLAGERLSREDGIALFGTRDIFTLGRLANSVRERLHGRRAYYNINRHINYTNYCVLRCKFCAFHRAIDGKTGGTPLANEAGYEHSLDEIVDLAVQAHENGATEVHIVGGLHPTLPFSFYVDMCQAIKQRCAGLHIKAFTAIEIVHFTRIARPRMSIEDVLIALREAGLDSMPGGGAEIFDDRVHAEAYKSKVGEKHWFDVHRAAHNLGIPSNATMLYGHIETLEERVEHMIKLRAHQDVSLERCGRQEMEGLRDQGIEGLSDQGTEGSRDQEIEPAEVLLRRESEISNRNTEFPNIKCEFQNPRSAIQNRKAAFNCFIPLSFIPDGSALSHLPGPTGLDDLRTLAVGRLMLDNFPHVKAFWIMHSPKLAQVALNWGVDDFDGTVVWYDITKREGRGSNRQELSVAQIRRLIREAGCEPVERDTLYRRIRRDEGGRVLI